MATIQKFQDLEIWQLANELSGNIFILTQSSLLSKDFALKDQMNRSSGSIADNIAEGFGRGGRIEFIQFLSIARASSSELQSQIIRCFQRKYIEENTYSDLIEMADKLGKKIGAFIQYLNNLTNSVVKFQNRQTNQPITRNEQQETKNEKQVTNNKKQETRNIPSQIPNNLVNSKNAAKPLGTYPHARKVGNLLFLSGIGSRRSEDNKIPGLELDENGTILSYDIAAETHQVMANVKAVLEESGSCWENIIDVTVFLTNMKNDFSIYNEIYATYFKHVQACRTTVEVKSLPTPIAIELKVIATID